MTATLSLSRLKGGLLLAALAVTAVPLAVRAQDVPDVTAPESRPPLPKGLPHPVVPRDAEKGTPQKGAGQSDAASPEQHAKLLDELYARLATAPDRETAAELMQTIERLWMHSGSATADLLVARASAAAEAENRELAMKLLNAAVEMQPDYTEAWNRRAYLYYLDNDFKRALGDLRRVLALDPRHYKALEGLGNLLLQLGEKKAALEAYENALKVNPNLPDAKKSRDELKVQVEGQGI